ncbi:hypothetical protein IJJ12_03380 [bacterium]|nr:hypothetical protein [bacterium]
MPTSDKIDFNHLPVPAASVLSGQTLNDRLRANFTQTPNTANLLAQARANNQARQAVVIKHEQEEAEIAQLRAQIAQIGQKQAQAQAAAAPTTHADWQAHKPRSVWKIFGGRK